LLCPNCKTELIEVNGRYICSDCGREIPENEVTTGDWSNTTPTTTGLYESAGTPSVPEDGSQAVADFETSPAEPADPSEAQTVEEVLQNQTNEDQTNVPEEKSPETQTAETVEAVLQEQADEAATEKPSEMPPIDLDIPEVEPPSDTGFYSAQTSPDEIESDSTPVQPVTPVSSTITLDGVEKPDSPSTSNVQNDNTEAPEALITPISELESPSVSPTVPEVQNIPVNVSVSDVTPPIQETETIPAPVQTEVVKDMFEDVPAAPINDPGLYAAPSEESADNSIDDSPVAKKINPKLPAEKRLNLLVLIIGSVLALALIGGGTWAYIALSAKAKVNIVPTITTQSATWQELQVVDAGFKISFPGQPVKTESTQTINSLDTPVITESYTTDDIVYTAAYATVNATADALPTFVNDLANLQGLTIVTTKVGTYYTADAIDFTLGDGTASYQGKIMLQDNTYILIMAGSSSGQTVDYDKFIKSFNFITASTGTDTGSATN
jgi:hypothetical protein